MTDTLEHTAKRIADRGRDALIARLRPAFADAASAHSEVLQIDDDQLEQMVQRAADRADGLQWRRALASVATEELGIGLGEALGHPAVARAQAIVGAPSYEDSLAELEARHDAPAVADLRPEQARPAPPSPPPPPPAQQQARPAQPAPAPPKPEPGAERAPEARPTQVRPATPAPAAARAQQTRPAPEPVPTSPAQRAPAQPRPPQPAPAAARPSTPQAPSRPVSDDPLKPARPPQPTQIRPAAAAPPPTTVRPAAAPIAKPEEPTTRPATAAAEAQRRPTPPAPPPSAPSASSGPSAPGAAPEKTQQRPTPAAATAAVPQPAAAPPKPAPAGAPDADTLRVAAIHLGGVTNLRPGESDIELRLSEHGLDIARESGQIIGRLGWDEIDGLEVPSARGLLKRRRAPRAHLVVRAGQGDASFEIPAIYPDELREHLDPLLARHGLAAV